MADEQKTVFISYRRSVAAFIARAIFLDLTDHGYDVFMDVESLESGHFNQIILDQIESRAHFLSILAPGTVERCVNPNDAVRIEIEYAIDKQRNIIPLLINGFSFNGTDQYLTGKLAALSSYNGLNVPHDFFDEAMERLRTRFLKQPVSGVVTPLPSGEAQVVQQKIKEVTSENLSAAVSPDALPRATQYADSQITLLQSLETQWRREKNRLNIWHEAAFTTQLDTVLAEMALSDARPVAEKAARLIGQTRSETAICQLDQAFRQGTPHAANALAVVRDEALSLPPCVSRGARVSAWLNNTRSQITRDPGDLWRRFWVATIISGSGFFLYSFAELYGASPTERLTKSISLGEFVGLTFGLVAVVAVEIPERLYKYWAWWLRLIVSFALGTALGILPWLMIFWVFLFYNPGSEDWGGILLGASGIGLAFALRSTVRIPAWLATLWAAVAVFLPIYLSWVNYLPPLLYVRTEEQISTYAIPIALLVAVGFYARGLLAEARQLWQRVWKS